LNRQAISKIADLWIIEGFIFNFFAQVYYFILPEARTLKL